MRCIVTGGNGFLGNAIVSELLKRDNEVIIIDREVNAYEKHNLMSIKADITDKDSIQKLFKGVNEVYHMAGVLGTSELNGNVYKAIEINITGAVHVIRASIDAGVSRLFYPTKPNVWNNVYSITKKTGEDFASLFNEQKGMKIICLRYFNAYGPAQHIYPVRKIIPTFCLLARFEKPLNIFGTGRNIVDMVYSRDIARWSVEATRNELNACVYDLGRGIPMSVLQVAEEVNNIAGNKGIVHSKTDLPA